MTYGIEYSPKALEDLRQIRDYISEELGNEKAASRVVKGILRNIRQLQNFPEIGTRLITKVNFDTDYRYLVCDNYVAFYRFENKTVRISRILNSRKNFMFELFGEDL